MGLRNHTILPPTSPLPISEVHPRKEFKAIWKELDPRIKHQLEEHYRILKREHFNSGKGKRRKKDKRFRFEGILKISLAPKILLFFGEIATPFAIFKTQQLATRQTRGI